MTASTAISLLLCWCIGPEHRQQAGIPAGRQADSVAVIDIRTPIDSVTAVSLTRRLEEAAKSGSDAVVFDLDTPGGEVDAMLEICHLIKQQEDILTVGWVNHQAYSAGALIALAADEIVVAPGSRMGDAAPIAAMPAMGLVELPVAERAKMEAPLLTEVVDSARRNGYDEKLVQSFVGVRFALWEIESTDGKQRRFVDANEYLEIFGSKPPVERLRGSEPKSAQTALPVDEETMREIDGLQDLESTRDLPAPSQAADWKLVGQVVGDEELLIVDDSAALTSGLATQRIADESELAAYFGATTITRYREHWSELLARFLMSWPVRIILVVVMIIAFLIEAAIPGTAVFGGIALICLGLLIGAPMLVGMAEWWTVALILAGLALLAAELFLTPGVGVLGLAGVASLLSGVVALVLTADPGSQEGSTQLTTLMIATTAAVIAGLSIAWWISKRTGRLGVLDQLVLNAETGTSSKPPATTSGHDPSPIEKGSWGTTVTDLRPGGRVRIEGMIHSARSTRGWVKAGTDVLVTGCFAGELEVEPRSEPDEGAPAESSQR
ncbi:MAG: ATP-dependent Clp protease proteolytic subunit [Planctomycetota bacterium]|nr:ATP-dependent Clp protease proteolytic subunit [Planctomycetota bacterium]MEC9158472.1 ATP-dependent Clp protease proteolytic subunit [Planctomycetota bacterium]